MNYTVSELLAVIDEVLLPNYKLRVDPNSSLKDLLNKHKKEKLPALLKNVKNYKGQTL